MRTMTMDQTYVSYVTLKLQDRKTEALILIRKELSTVPTRKMTMMLPI